jgi:hypothetical protein
MLACVLIFFPAMITISYNRSQAYETRADFARQRTTLTGIQTRMAGVLSESIPGVHRTSSLTSCRSNSWDQQSVGNDQNSSKKRRPHYRMYYWTLYCSPPHLHVLTPLMLRIYHITYIIRCLVSVTWFWKFYHFLVVQSSVQLVYLPYTTQVPSFGIQAELWGVSS